MCHLSQPAFSALIRAMEQTVGLKLFDRSTRHVVLTREGERFLQSAERLAAEFAACERAMRDTAQLAQGTYQLHCCHPLPRAGFLRC